MATCPHCGKRIKQKNHASRTIRWCRRHGPIERLAAVAFFTQEQVNV